MKKAEIIAAARRRMMHYGIQKTTMQEIAQEVGMAVGSLYLHFKNKEEIVLAIAEEYRAQQTDLTECILNSSDSPEDKIRQLLLERFRFIAQFREGSPHGKEFVRVLMQLKSTCSQEWRERFIDIFSRVLEEGRQQKLFFTESPQQDAEVLFLSLQMFYPLPYLELPVWPQEAELIKVIDWFIDHWKRPKGVVHA